MPDKKKPAKITWGSAIMLVLISIIISAYAGWVSGSESMRKIKDEELEESKSEYYESGYNEGYSNGLLAVSEEENQTDLQTETVYITNTGEKYHRWGCQYLGNSAIPISRTLAIVRGYTACSRCW